MKKFLTYIILFFFPAVSILAGNSFSSIAAIVDEEIISTRDVYNRIDLTMTMLGIEKNQANADSLLPKIVQQLIDEKLILKETNGLKIDVSQSEIKNAINEVEEHNNLGHDGLFSLAKQNNISTNIVLDQIKAQVLWQKLVSYTIRNRVTVSDKEVEEVLNVATPGQAEITFKQLLFPIEFFKSEEDMNQQIMKLTELRNNISSCHDLEIIAKVLPIKGEADTLTIPLSQIHPDLQNMIKTLPVGKASKIIKSKTSLRVISICSRDFIGLDNRSKKEVTDIIFQKKLMTQANHYISNLRKRAFIEVYI